MPCFILYTNACIDSLKWIIFTTYVVLLFCLGFMQQIITILIFLSSFYLSFKAKTQDSPLNLIFFKWTVGNILSTLFEKPDILLNSVSLILTLWVLIASLSCIFIIILNRLSLPGLVEKKKEKGALSWSWPEMNLSTPADSK